MSSLRKMLSVSALVGALFVGANWLAPAQAQAAHGHRGHHHHGGHHHHRGHHHHGYHYGHPHHHHHGAYHGGYHVRSYYRPSYGYSRYYMGYNPYVPSYGYDDDCYRGSGFSLHFGF